MQLNPSNDRMLSLANDFLDRDISLSDVKPTEAVSSSGSMSDVLSFLRHSHGLSCFPLTVKLVAKRQNINLYYPIGSDELVASLSNWQCQNFNLDEINQLKQSIVTNFKNNNDVQGFERFIEAMRQECVSHKGMAAFYATHWQVKQPAILIAEPCVKKWKDSTELLGFGSTQIVQVPLDNHGVLDIESTDRLLDRALNKYIPILSLVAVTGDTDEATKQSKKELNERQQYYKSKGLDVVIHHGENC